MALQCPASTFVITATKSSLRQATLTMLGVLFVGCLVLMTYLMFF